MWNMNFAMQVYKKKLKIKNCLMFCMVARTVCIYRNLNETSHYSDWQPLHFEY